MKALIAVLLLAAAASALSDSQEWENFKVKFASRDHKDIYGEGADRYKIFVSNLRAAEANTRENIEAAPADRGMILGTADIFRAKIVDVSPSTVTVEITGADGQTIQLVTNSVGNFFYNGPLAMPYEAKVVRDGAEKVMAGAQSDGECASCHTAEGASGAPGRITAP